MANFPWFKFYGGEYLGDSKMTALSAADRSCWLTLLCYASQDQGRVRHLTEIVLMVQSGVQPETAEWESTKGVLERLAALEMIRNDNGMITLVNWKKRQESQLTGYERVKRYRERQKLDEYDNADDNAEITVDRDKDKEGDKEKREKLPHETLNYLRKLPKKDAEEFATRFGVSEETIRSKAEDLLLYCESKKKKYSNYRSFLLNALKKDLAKTGDKAGGKYSGVGKRITRKP